MVPIENIDRQTDIIFMALCLWREARNQSTECITAVACSILNRVSRPKWWGTTVQGVVTKKWQYSSLTDPNDKQLTFYPQRNDQRWALCVTLATVAMEGGLINPTPGADSYYDDSIPPPRWATKETFVRKIDRICFHNLDRDIETEAVAVAVQPKL